MFSDSTEYRLLLYLYGPTIRSRISKNKDTINQNNHRFFPQTFPRNLYYIIERGKNSNEHPIWKHVGEFQGRRKGEEGMKSNEEDKKKSNKTEHCKQEKCNAMKYKTLQASPYDIYFLF